MYLATGIGGIIGALVRFFISNKLIHLGYFPTLFINLSGCFLLGYLQGRAKMYVMPAWLVTGIGTGMIGAYTTFSTFSMEVVHSISQGLFFSSFFYILVSSIGGYLSAYTGFLSSGYKERGR